jgi:3'(2'), 5'-bisphosphate nucleotidase
MSPPYASEASLALRIVHAASLLTKSVLRSLKNNVTAETKADDSPVTIADFAAQALIISALHAVYPEDAFLGEESAKQLRENEELAERVWVLVQQASSQFSDLQHVRMQQGGTTTDAEDVAPLRFPASKEVMLDVIDRGTGEQTKEGRVWVMDPVDGTATFMTGNQYAVCLCLLVDGVQQVGVIGCPNLAIAPQSATAPSRIHEDSVDDTGYGVVLSAVKDHGTHVRSMHADGLGEPRRILHEQSAKSVRDLNFVETTIGKTSLSQQEHHAVADVLGAKWPGTVLWSQQMKYAALALGATDAMLRLPKGKERYTYVWDHAGGQLLFQEVGGVIKDCDGGDIDFAQGRRIEGTRNFGMVASMPGVFDDINRAVNEVLGRRAL